MLQKKFMQSNNKFLHTKWFQKNNVLLQTDFPPFTFLVMRPSIVKQVSHNLVQEVLICLHTDNIIQTVMGLVSEINFIKFDNLML